MKTVVYRLYQGVLLAAAVGLVGFLLSRELVPTGTLTIQRETGKSSPFWSRPLPDERTEEVYVDEDGRSFQSVVGDPVYITLAPPTDFETVKVQVAYKPTELPVVEIGGLVNPESDAYTLKPLENKLLDALDWTERREGDVVLYDRTGVYASLADFLVNPPPLSEIATYHYRFDRPFRLSGYRPMSVPQTFSVSLRGAHEALTYISGEELRFTVAYTDMNRTQGEDPIELLVFNQSNELVAAKAIGDDGNVGSGGEGSALREVSVRAQVPDGVYKIIWKANRDIFIRRITTPQQKLVFLHQIFLGDEVGYREGVRATRVWTDAKNVSLETQHAEGVQEVTFGRMLVAVEEPFVQARVRVREANVVVADIPKGDILLRGAGHFALSAESFFNPEPLRLEWDTHLDARGINYVVATYTPPEERDGLVLAQATFDAQMLAKMRGAWKFALSLPGIYDTQGSLDVHSYKATLSRTPLTLATALRRIWQAVRP
ncbi:hypothetical protein HYW18_04090 [Candidatus Uhrbacteria bacterium]|nr:hypothetical protein [Candidatus Uhrbacteria bacterium]